MQPTNRYLWSLPGGPRFLCCGGGRMWWRALAVSCVRSVCRSPAPSVIRLNRFVKVPFVRGIAVNRRSIFARDDHLCQYCRRAAENLDHVVPRSRGGEHVWENVVACCSRCNARKGDKLLSELTMSLIGRPTAPSRFGWVYARAGTELDPRWESYIA